MDSCIPDGVIRDKFTLMKGVNRTSRISVKKGNSLDLTASFIGSYKWNKSKSSERTLHLNPTTKGTMFYEVTDAARGLKDRFEKTVSDQ